MLALFYAAVLPRRPHGLMGECRFGGTGLALGQVPQCKSCLTPASPLTSEPLPLFPSLSGPKLLCGSFDLGHPVWAHSLSELLLLPLLLSIPNYSLQPRLVTKLSASFPRGLGGEGTGEQPGPCWSHSSLN